MIFYFLSAILISYIISSSEISASNPHVLDLHSLEHLYAENGRNIVENLHGKEVAVRGFLYSKEPTEYIIATTPDVKSCCVGASHKRHLQLRVKGNFPEISSNSAINLRGTFIVSHLEDHVGQWNPSFHLKDAQLVESKKDYASLLVFIFIGMSGVAMTWIFKTIQRKGAKTPRMERSS